MRPIANCPLEMVCDRRWEDLIELPDAAVRHCTECETEVHFCHSIEELLAHAKLGHCVAFNLVEDDRAHGGPHPLVGFPGDPDTPSRSWLD